MRILAKKRGEKPENYEGKEQFKKNIRLNMVYFQHLDCTAICIKNLTKERSLIKIDLSNIDEIEENSSKVFEKIVKSRGFEFFGIGLGLKKENWEKMKISVEPFPLENKGD